MKQRCEFCKQLVRTETRCANQGQAVDCARLRAKKDGELLVRDIHIAMMKASDDWRRWPVQALKMPGHISKPGFLVAGKGPIVYRGNIFSIMPGDQWESFSREEYASFEALYLAGWRID